MNEDRFTHIASIYAKHRPTYPETFIDYLYGEVGFGRDSAVADIGSGTGIFTELLLRRGSTVFGVEPNADMRGTAVAALSQYENFRPVAASAEATGLPDGSVDFITVAQAFHWFDRESFRRECQRLLKDGGKVVLVWNSRDHSSELVRESEAVTRRWCPAFRGFSGGMDLDAADSFAGFFRGGTWEHRDFDNELTFDEDGFLGRSLSASYAPREGSDAYAPYLMDLRELFRRHSRSGVLHLPNRTRSYVGGV